MGPSPSGEINSCKQRRVRREHDVTVASSFSSSTITRGESQASLSDAKAYPASVEGLDRGHFSSEYERQREYNRRNAARTRLRIKEQTANLIKQVEDLKCQLESTEHQKLELEIQLTDLREENKRLYEMIHQQRQGKNQQHQTLGMTELNGDLGNNPIHAVTSDKSFLAVPSVGGEIPSVQPLLASDMGGALTNGMNPRLLSNAGAMTQQPVLPVSSSPEPQLHQPLNEINMAATLALLIQSNPTFVQGFLTSAPPTTQQPPLLPMPQSSTISSASTTASPASAAFLAALLAINQEKAAGHAAGVNGSLQP